jgi:cytochrome c553
MKLKLSASLCLAVAAVTGSATALASEESVEAAQREYDMALSKTPDLENGKRLYLTCAVCHRPEGWGTEDGTYPQIAGQVNTVIIKQLADIRARNRDNPIMYPFAVPRIFGGAQEIADVAAYIAALPMTPHNGIGPGMDLALGEKLYRENCVECHGQGGEGDSNEHIPALWGQHYRYLVRQFEWIKAGKRRNADPKMQKQIQGFSARDIHAVMDYVSRLRPPAERTAENPDWHNPDFPNYVRPPMPAPVPNI